MLGGSENAAGLNLRRINGTEIINGLIRQQAVNGADYLGIVAGTQNAVYLRHFFHNLILVTLGQTACD